MLGTLGTFTRQTRLPSGGQAYGGLKFRHFLN